MHFFHALTSPGEIFFFSLLLVLTCPASPTPRAFAYPAFRSSAPLCPATDEILDRT